MERVTDRIFCYFGQFFALLSPPNNLKNQNFEKMKQIPADIIILHMCTKCMVVWMYGWMVHEISHTMDRIFVILDHFLPFYPPNNLKNQNFEKMKKTSGDIIVLHMCTINDIHMICGS